jgi:phosphohistidine swiveling domain-containing protein
MSHKNYNWEIAAHDYNSPYLRNHLWVHSFFKYEKLLDVSRPALGIASRNNQIEYLTDFSTWRKTHEELKKLVLSDFNYFEKLIDKSVEWGEQMNAWTEENIFENDLEKLSGPELIELLKKFIDMQETEYAYGTSLSILDFQGFSFVEGNLNDILKKKVLPEKFQDYYAVFTEPESNSFAQDQEEDLLRLCARWDGIAWRHDMASKDLDGIKEAYPDFYAGLSQHAQKYAWVYYVYSGPAFKEEDFYGFVVDYLKKDIIPKQKLNENREKRERIAKLKKEYLEDLKTDGFERFILQIASKVVWAKPRRKDYQSKSYYHAEKLCLEIAGRMSISLDQVRSAPTEILEKALMGKRVDLSISDSIKKLHICLPKDDGTVLTLVGEEAEEFSGRSIGRKNNEQDVAGVSELKGSIACRGKAMGKVRIINLPEDMAKMEQDDILVSAATTPSIVVAMKKAAAIVTDEGGLTCHAAIVSRELGIPCIVGTKIATQVLKDGDLVEVDADKGIVKIIEKIKI